MNMFPTLYADDWLVDDIIKQIMNIFSLNRNIYQVIIACTGVLPVVWSTVRLGRFHNGQDPDISRLINLLQTM